MKQLPSLTFLAVCWWWEMGATVLSLTSLSLIITLLTYIDDAPLSDWPLPIQPNSLLAVLTTAMKTTMLVSVTSCIGQLKWRHFATRARSIHELESLDDASRGPWGALILIFTLRAKSLMSICLAISSLLALGIEPSTQQIINIKTRDITVPNDSALTSRAEAYFSEADEQGLPIETNLTKILTDSLYLDQAFDSVLGGSVRGPYYECPAIASRCIWDDFSTLAVCSHFQNVTEAVSYNCDFVSNVSKSSGSGNVTCTFQYPDDTAFTKGIPHISPLELTYTFNREGFGSDSPTHKSVNSTATIISLWVLHIDISDLLSGPPKFNSSTTFLQAFESSSFHSYKSYVLDFYWCNKTLRNITTSGRGLTAELAASTPWKPCSLFPEETQGDDRLCYYYWSSLGNISLNQWPIPYLYSLDTGSRYNISASTFSSMTAYMQRRQGDLMNLFEQGFVDVEATTADMAAALTEYMLRPQGDNLNVTTVTGYMIISETYIHTEWIWLLLPIFEILFTVFLLIVTIIITRHQPILKHSVLALLIHGLSGWSQEELRVSEPEEPSTLEKLMTGQRAVFKKDQYGVFKFIKMTRKGKNN
ncbi:hypothetical protein F4680DRAFT_204003 [Xylaria scruposa]|nr:hypothetical protein F4680DRAFT_204003 [Xylaria scruposa]